MADARTTILERLTRLVSILGPDNVDKVTLVGGTAPAMFEMAGAPLRMTDDIDLVLPVQGPLDWYRYVGEMETRGFRASTAEGAPICRYVHGDLVVDVMPTDDRLGFTNAWYPEAVRLRQSTPVAGLHVLPPIVFLATKFEAFFTRGLADPATSRDLEDIVLVLRGKRQLFDDIASGNEPLHASLRTSFRRLTSMGAAIDYVVGMVEGDEASQRAARALFARMKAIGDT